MVVPCHVDLPSDRFPETTGGRRVRDVCCSASRRTLVEFRQDLLDFGSEESRVHTMLSSLRKKAGRRLFERPLHLAFGYVLRFALGVEHQEQ